MRRYIFVCIILAQWLLGDAQNALFSILTKSTSGLTTGDSDNTNIPSLTLNFGQPSVPSDSLFSHFGIPPVPGKGSVGELFTLPHPRLDESVPTTTKTTLMAGGCKLPEQPKGGRYKCHSTAEDPSCSGSPGDNVPSSSIILYSCDDDYIFKGDSTFSLCKDGSWQQQPSCIKKCGPLDSSTVDIECTLYGNSVPCEAPAVPGTLATVECKPSHYLPSNVPIDREIKCLSDGKWDKPLYSCIAECGTVAGDGTTFVVNGIKATHGGTPWHVGIYRTQLDGTKGQICGGTLIRKNHVLSAAHCFYDETRRSVDSESLFSVAAAKYRRDWDFGETYMQKSDVAKIRIPRRYLGFKGNYVEDIALIVLKTPFTFSNVVKPICFDWNNIYEREQLQLGQTGKVVGWGVTEKREPAEELQEINLPFIPFLDCEQTFPDNFRHYVTQDKFCAGYQNGSSLCNGDSGGGLCFQRGGLWYLRGVVSVGPSILDVSRSLSTCDNNHYTVFTNVGSFTQWLQETMDST